MDATIQDPPSSNESLSSPLPNLCIVCSIGAEYGLFIIDLNDDVHHPTADDEYEFGSMIPNIRLRDLGFLCIFVVKSTVYMFDASAPSAASSKAYNKSGHNSVYMYKLPKYVLELSDFIVEKSLISDGCPLHSLKHSPNAIPCDLGIVVYSYEIMFDDHRRRGANLYDFELYDLDGKKSEKLPALSIRPKEHVSRHWDEEICWDEESCSYEMYDHEGSMLARFDGASCRSTIFFVIRGASIVDKHTLVVQSEMGQVFMLDLRSPSGGWKLFTGGWLMKHVDDPFFITGDDGEICVSARGAYNMRIQDWKSKYDLWSSVEMVTYKALEDDIYLNEMKEIFKKDELDFGTRRRLDLIDRSIPLPRSGSGMGLCCDTVYDHQVSFGLGGGCACIVEMVIDESRFPHFVIDVVKVDFSKFPKFDGYLEFPVKQQLAIDKEKEWAELVKTLKIYMPWTCYTCIIHDVIPLEISTMEVVNKKMADFRTMGDLLLE